MWQTILAAAAVRSEAVRRYYVDGGILWVNAQLGPSDPIESVVKKVADRMHMRLLQQVTDPSTTERRKAAAVLGELLGDDHDLFELRRRVSIDTETFGGIAARWTFVSLIDRRRHGLQTEAFGLGASLFAEKPKAFVKRIGKAWTGDAG